LKLAVPKKVPSRIFDVKISGIFPLEIRWKFEKKHKNSPKITKPAHHGRIQIRHQDA
jgi:hypothetical protein